MINSEFDIHNDTSLFPITEIVPLNLEGATSRVYKVRLNGKWHFLKRPKQAFTCHPLYIAAFEKEFSIGYTLDHSNIVRYVSIGNDGDGIFLLTEYVDGITLKDFLALNPGYFRFAKNRNKFMLQLLSALEYLHSRQILHLDLKPENILITHIHKDVKLIDLGFAYNDCYQFHSSGATKAYAAPEQLCQGTIDERTDIYALGLILLFIFSGTTDVGKIKSVPHPYKNVVQKCLRKNSAERFQSIQEVEYSLTKPTRTPLLAIFTLFAGVLLALAGYLYGDKSIMFEDSIASTLLSILENRNFQNDNPEGVDAEKAIVIGVSGQNLPELSGGGIKAIPDSIPARAKSNAATRDSVFRLYQYKMATIFVPIDSLLQTNPADGRHFILKYKELYANCLAAVEKDSICKQYFNSSFNPFSTYTNELLKKYQRSAYLIYNANTP